MLTPFLRAARWSVCPSCPYFCFPPSHNHATWCFPVLLLLQPFRLLASSQNKNIEVLSEDRRGVKAAGDHRRHGRMKSQFENGRGRRAPTRIWVEEEEGRPTRMTKVASRKIRGGGVTLGNGRFS